MFCQTKELRFDESGEKLTSPFLLHMLKQRDCATEALAASGGHLSPDYNCVK